MQDILMKCKLSCQLPEIRYMLTVASYLQLIL